MYMGNVTFRFNGGLSLFAFAAAAGYLLHQLEFFSLDDISCLCISFCLCLTFS